MTEPLPTVFVPGTAATLRVFENQLPVLWRFGPVMVADHTRDETMADIARRILANAPARFTLIGFSMGGYIAFEILRQAPERVARLALLDTSARPDSPEQAQRRDQQIMAIAHGRLMEIGGQLFPIFVHPNRRDDHDLRDKVLSLMAETGPEAFIRQLKANKSRPDSRPGLSAIRCPTLVVVGDTDLLTPPELSAEIALAIPGAELVQIPDSGHLTPLEQPARLTAALTSWLNSF